jgi:ribosome recycling factor
MDVHEAVKADLLEAQSRMQTAIDALLRELQAIRTGRANISVLDDVHVDYYGTSTPLNQLASLAAPDPQLLVVQPYDRSAIPAIERAIMTSDLGLNPNSDGLVVRIPIPELTQERRQELAKQVGVVAEHSKTVLRQVRRDANEAIKRHEQDKDLSEDDGRRAHDQAQELTNAFVAKVDALAEAKREELLKI